MNLTGNLVLALETGIEGGSVSIWDCHLGIEIGSMIGETSVSKSEDILNYIDILFEKHSIDKKDFNSVILATEVGSATGLKIGEALAKGLAKSFGCSYKEISLWEVSAFITETDEKKSLSAVKKIYFPVGQGRIARRCLYKQQFYGNAEIITSAEFHNNLLNPIDGDYFVYETLIENFLNVYGINCIRRSLAPYIAKAASDNARQPLLDLNS